MAKIFISYRREDSAYATGVIRDQLASRLDGCEIFFDVDSIPYGVDFRRHLENSVAACDFLVAVIGKSWLTVVDAQGQRRLENPNDAVRVEVETALARNIPLIPVFLDGMDVPSADKLPDSLRDLVGRNAIFVRPPPDFNNDVAKLVQAFKRWLDQGAPGYEQPDAARQVTSPPARASRRGLLALGAIAAALLVALAAGGWWYYAARGRPLDHDSFNYDFQETYLFEDSDPKPASWQAHSRMLDGGFKPPVQFVHWVVRVTHAGNIAPTHVPLECRLLDADGKEVVKFSGVSGELPDKDSPTPGIAEWIFTFGSREKAWKPGKYTMQLDSPLKTASTTFEVFAP